MDDVLEVDEFKKDLQEFDSEQACKSQVETKVRVKQSRIKGQKSCIINLLKDNPNLSNQEIFDALQNNTFKDKVLKYDSVSCQVSQVKGELKKRQEVQVAKDLGVEVVDSKNAD